MALPPPDPNSDYHEEMKRQARREFPAFFAIATPAEAQVLDAAYVGAQAYRQAVHTPRPDARDPMRHPLEIVTNNAEQLLMFVRDALRRTPAFAQLPPEERAKMEARLFD